MFYNNFICHIKNYLLSEIVPYKLYLTAFLFITIFIYFNYPESWRKNRMFIATLILWHIIGLASVVMVFTVFKHITHEGMKYELARIGTCYYIVTTMQAILFTL